MSVNRPTRRLSYLAPTLLVVGLLVVTVAYKAAAVAKAVANRTDAVAAILDAGGAIRCDFQIDHAGNPLPAPPPPKPSWVRYWIGDDVGSNVVEASVRSDDALVTIRALPQLRRLHLFSAGITDAGLAYLEHLPQLEAVRIEETKVTEQGIDRLRKALPRCQVVQ